MVGFHFAPCCVGTALAHPEGDPCPRILKGATRFLDRPDAGKTLYDAGFRAGLEAERSDNADWLRSVEEPDLGPNKLWADEALAWAADEIERGVCALDPGIKIKLWVQFSDCGQHIRKWAREPFEGATLFAGYVTKTNP